MRVYHFSFRLYGKEKDFSCPASSLKVALKTFSSLFPGVKVYPHYSVETNGICTHRKLKENHEDL